MNLSWIVFSKQYRASERGFRTAFEDFGSYRKLNPARAAPLHAEAEPRGP